MDFKPETLPFNDPRTERKVAIVTGAGLGLGASMAHALADADASVV